MSFDHINEPSVFPRAMLLKLGLVIAAMSATLFVSSAAIAQTRPPSAAAQTAYKLGIEALGKKDFSAALRQLTIACDGSVAGGCFHLAGIYYLGRGRPKDAALAAKFHARSCDLGDADGCDLAGRQYHNGDGVAQDYKQAISFYRKALTINPGHESARVSLPIAERAQTNAAAENVAPSLKQAFAAGAAARARKDYQTALGNYAIACTGGYGAACFGLANALELGEGVAPDKGSAAKFYDRACALRYASGCINLGALYHDGDGVPQSFDRALAAYRRALVIEPQNEVAQDNIALAQQKRARLRVKTGPVSVKAQQAFEAGVAAYGKNDFAAAQRQFGAACDGRLANGCYSLGVMISRGEGVTPDKARAAKLFAAACTGGNANACYNLGLLYDDGTGVARNLATAASYYAKACDATSASGCYNAGVAYDRGDGVTQSIERALGYYRRALVIDPKLAAADKAIASAEKRRATRQ